VKTLLALCGSLRAASLHRELLGAAQDLAPAGVKLRIVSDLGALPLFNPDLEAELPAAVRRLHAEVAGAEALVIASPEYAHGVTGTIKNALDWLVSFEPFVGQRVAIWKASPRARHADAALRETLRTMSAEIVEPACLSLPLLGARLDAAGIRAAPAMADPIRAALRALAQGPAPAAAPGWLLRPAQAGDATRLAALALQVWLSTYAWEGVSEDIAAYVLARFTPAAFAELLADAQRLLLVGEGPGGLLGYAQLRRGAPQGGLEVELETLYVQAPAQGTGLAQALLAQARLAAYRQLGAPAIWLSVNARNERALNFYRRAGCIECGETWFELGGGRHLNLLLRTAPCKETQP